MTLELEIDKAVAILQAGGLVAMPTETVYGLAADARNPTAVGKIFTVKQRPNTHPLIVHLADPGEMGLWAREMPTEALRLAETCWPGPLTLILKKRPEVLDSVTGGQDTVALRMPRHPAALALLRAFGGGLVAPSANRFTRVSPTTAAAVYAELGEQVDMILDGGACEVGLESTILDLSGTVPRILRPGMLTAAAISVMIGRPVQAAAAVSDVRAPGMHHLHYAPSTRTQVLSAMALKEMLPALPAADLPAVCLTWSGLSIPAVTCVVMPRHPAAYAHDLYTALRAQDQAQYQHIFLEAVPEGVEWDAIRDRLQKASGQANITQKGSTAHDDKTGSQ